MIVSTIISVMIELFYWKKYKVTSFENYEKIYSKKGLRLTAKGTFSK